MPRREKIIDHDLGPADKGGDLGWLRINVQEFGEKVPWNDCNHARLLRGELRWQHLSNRELERGLGFGAQGDFSGVLRKFGPITGVLLQAYQAETMRRAAERMNRLAFRGINIVEEIMEDFMVDAKDRLKAVDMVWNRNWGSPTQRIAVSVDDRFDMILNSVAGIEPDPEFDDPDLTRVNAALTMGSPDDEEIWDVESWDDPAAK